MYRRKSIQVLGVLAVFSSSTPIVLATDVPVYPARNFAQSMITEPSGFSDDSAAANDAVPSVQTPAAPQMPEKPALESVHSKPASQPPESFYDRFIAVGIAAGLFVFAFFRKKTPQSLPAIKHVESSKFPSPVEMASAEPPAAAAAELAAGDESIAAQAIGRNVVVPVDFSPNSEFAIRLALVWSKPNDRLKIVYACDVEKAFPPENLTPSNLTAIHPAFENIDSETAHHWSQLPWVVVLPLAIEIVERWAVNEFERLWQTIGIAERERVEFHVLHGDPVHQIVKLSEKISAKLIVLVAHRHFLTDRLISGSHADRLLHVSRIPVIVVCEPVQSEPGLPLEILITTDYSSESLPVFMILKDLLQGVKPNITVLTVETEHDHPPKTSAMFADLEQAFRSLGLQLRTVKIEASDVEAGILDYVKTHKPQLIAMSSHGRLGFAELIHPSVTKAILHDAGVPILVVHGPSSSARNTVGSLSDFLRIITG